MGSGNKTTIGHKYIWTIVTVHAIGAIDSIKRIKIGGKLAWKGNITQNSRIRIDKKNLFGGERSGGGVQGWANINFGRSDQQVNEYLQSKFPDGILPAHRGVFSIIWEDFYWGNSPQQPQIEVELQAVNADDDFTTMWYLEKAAVISEPEERLDLNIVHVLRNVLTNPILGRYLESELDDESWRSAADVAFSEGKGVTLNLRNSTDDRASLLSEIMGLLSCTLYETNEGKLGIKLLRKDYDLIGLPEFNKSNCKLVKFDTPSGKERINGLNIKFTRAQYTKKPEDKDYGEDIEYVDDVANSTATASYQINNKGAIETINASIITNPQFASDYGRDEIDKINALLPRITINANMQAQTLQPGDVYILNYGYPLSDEPILVRIIDVDYGDISDNSVKITGVKDRFSSLKSIVSPSQKTEWTDPNNSAEDVLNKIITEAPYYTLATEFSETVDIDNLTNLDSYVWMVCKRPTTDSISFEPNFLPDGTDNSSIVLDVLDFANTSRTKNQISFIDTEIELFLFEELSSVEAGSYAVIDNEIIAIKSIDYTTGKIIVDRAVLDTVPAKHNQNTIIYFAGGSGSIASRSFLKNDNPQFKLLTITGIDKLTLSSASKVSTEVVARQAKPYPPGKIRINNKKIDADGVISVDYRESLNITWASRNRLTQTGTGFVTQDDDSVLPEPNTKYNLTFRTPDSQVVKEFKNLDVLFKEYFFGDIFADFENAGGYVPVTIFEIESVRDTIESYQKHTIEIHRAPDIDDITVEYNDTVNIDNNADIIEVI